MLALEWLLWICAAVIIYHMVLHPLFLIMMSRVMALPMTSQAQLDSQYMPDIDIVMPIYNEADCIVQKLENLAALNYPLNKLNLYIGLDGCSDESLTLINDRLTTDRFQDISCHVINFPQNRGKIKVLNDLMSLGKADIVFLTDASALLPANAIRGLTSHFTQTDVGAVSAGYQLVESGQEGESAYWRYQTQVKQAESQLGSVIGAHGSCYALRRSLFRALPAETINDDFILPMNIISQGYRVIYDTEVVALELEGSSTTQDFNRRKRLSLGNIQQVFACADVLKPHHGWVAFNFLFGKVIRALMPLLLALIFVSSALLSSMWFYQLLFAMQLLAYGITVGCIVSRKEPENTYLYLIFYVVSGYIAGLIGAVQFLSGKANYSWSKK